MDKAWIESGLVCSRLPLIKIVRCDPRATHESRLTLTLLSSEPAVIKT